MLKAYIPTCYVAVTADNDPCYMLVADRAERERQGPVLFRRRFPIARWSLVWGFKERLRRCFTHLTVSRIFGHATPVLCLVLHLTLGYRRLRDMRYYSDDALVMRTLGLRRLPDVATLSRGLARADAESVKRLQGLVREGVVSRLVPLELSRVTLDFDGSVIGTGKSAEGTAVGFEELLHYLEALQAA